jgi:hypothetical protein
MFRPVGLATSSLVKIRNEQHATAMLRYAWLQSGRQETAQEGLQEAFPRYFVKRTYGH